jgi:cell wall-associated NlpC family hydrolase
MTAPPGTDRRSLRCARGVAHDSLRGQVAADSFVAGTQLRVTAPLIDLCSAPGGPRDRQLPLGTGFTDLVRAEGWVFGFDDLDGYCGWVPELALGPDAPVTHRVCAPSSHLYPEPDIKSRERAALPCLARVRVTGTQGRFAETALGFVPVAHLCQLDQPLSDPVAVARGLLGVPYLWGGNSAAGIDCSGLVQVARRACGLSCPADSDQQAAMPGQDIAAGHEAPGDLVFWRGHVAMVSAPGLIVHANAHHMAVTEEPLSRAEARIAAGGDPVQRRLRPFG